MNLARPPESYDANDQAQMRRMISDEDKRNQKRGSNVLLRAPNGSLWSVGVDNSGVLTVTAA